MSDEDAPRPREISTRLAAVVILTSTALMLCVCVLPVIFLELPFRLFFGWGFFLADAVPRTSFSVFGTISAVAFLGALTLILKQVLRRNTEASASRQPAGWKSTFRLVAIPILLFAAGIGFVGVASSSIWLATTENAARRVGAFRRQAGPVEEQSQTNRSWLLRA